MIPFLSGGLIAFYADWCDRRAGQRLSRIARERQAAPIRETTNAMRAHLGLPGRLGEGWGGH